LPGCRLHGGSILGRLGNLEHRHRAAQALRLDLQRGGGGRGLFDHRRILLRGPLDVGHRVVHRRDASGLFGGGARDLGHDLRHPIDRRQHVAHRVAGQVHLAHARLDPRRRVLDQALDFAGGLRAALRQRTHFARDHGKTLALFARTRRFHRGVQRQDVGLKGDAVHHPDDFADAPRAVGNALHALHDFLHRLAAALRQPGGAFGLPAGLVRVAGRHLDGVRQLGHVGRGLLQRTGLARRAIGHVRPAGRDLARARMDFLDALAHGGHGSRQPGLHAAHG